MLTRLIELHNEPTIIAIGALPGARHKCGLSYHAFGTPQLADGRVTDDVALDDISIRQVLPGARVGHQVDEALA